MPRAYLDHNATSPLKPAARAAMLAALDGHGNASSVHREGRGARAAVNSARDVVARRIGVLPQMIVFVSGGTEANNLAVKGAAVERLVVSAIEHPSVAEAARARGLPIEVMPVDGNGRVKTQALQAILDASPLPTLVSVMLANNETGVVQPVAEIVNIARSRNAIVHADAVQALGKIPVNVPALGVDLMTVSAHKLGGPVGVGALIVRDGLALEPLIAGGTQELRRRAGTENVGAIAGFAAALEDTPVALASLRDRLERELSEISPDVEFFGKNVERLPNTSCFAVRGIAADTALISLDLDGVAVSSGAACSSGKVGHSAVLEAMGVAPDTAKSAIRVSLGWNTTPEDIEAFIGAWRRIVERRKKKAA